MNVYKKFIINVLGSSYLLPTKIRKKIYNLAGLKLDASGIRAKCFFNSEFVEIGQNSSINFFCQFHSTPKSKIVLGENVYVGMNVNFCTVSHELGNANKRAGNNIYLPINVGNGTWIGANTTILPGVNIGEGCVIAAGSLVNKNCETNGLYAGIPAKRIKNLK